MVDQHLQHLLALIGENRIFASYEFMKGLPANTPIPNKHNLFCDLEAKVFGARDLSRQANGLLKRGAYPKALAHLDRARQLVADFPNIYHEIYFVEGSLAQLEQSLADAEVAADRGEQRQVREFLRTASRIDSRNIAILRIRKKLQKSVRKRRAQNILLTSLLILIPFIYMGYEQVLF
ncbi:MAG: hypothetical protein RI601_11120 [Desulfurivibrionaceae bacterium]|nr:hypothetical protein [Desulfurivibrionaceae bacterium]